MQSNQWLEMSSACERLEQLIHDIVQQCRDVEHILAIWSGARSPVPTNDDSKFNQSLISQIGDLKPVESIDTFLDDLDHGMNQKFSKLFELMRTRDTISLLDSDVASILSHYETAQRRDPIRSDQLWRTQMSAERQELDQFTTTAEQGRQFYVQMSAKLPPV